MLNDIVTVRDEEVAQEEQKGFWGRLFGSSAGGLQGAVTRATTDFLTEDPSRARAVEGGLEAIGQSPEAARIAPGASTVIGAAGEGLDWFDEQVFQPAMAGIATPVVAAQIVDDQFGSNPKGFFEGGTWSEAWEHAQNTHFGRAVAESVLLPPEKRIEYREQGFDEFGNPVNEAYADLRKNDAAYNLISGPLDFFTAWVAAPEVLAAKGVTKTRALTKGDLDRLGVRTQARIRHIASVPEEHLAQLKRDTPAWDVVGKRAIGLREQTLALRNQVRKGALKPTDLAEMQAFRNAAQGPTAAFLFSESAKARKINPKTGELMDDFDDDLFDTVNAAMLGNELAAQRLAGRADEIGDAVKALNQVKMQSLDDVTRWGEQILDVQTTPHLTDAERPMALIGPQYRLDRAVEEHGLLEQGLRQYQHYEDFVDRALREKPAVSMTPRDAQSVGQLLEGATASTFRPTAHSNVASQVITTPHAAWLKRAGIASLHSSEDVFEGSTRLFNQGQYYAGARGLDDMARDNYNAGSWNELKDRMLNRAAAAGTDVERARIMTRIEEITVEGVARKYGLDGAEARGIAEHVRGMKDSMVRQAEQQAQKSYSQATVDGKRIDAYRHKNADGTEEIIPLPVDVTQLRQTFIAIDLRALDSMLANHANSIKAILVGRPREATQHALELFNHYWKPSVLFRVGYPVRNVIDDGLRAGAANMSFGYMMNSGKAVAAGARNIPTRAFNRYARTRNFFTDNSPTNKPIDIPPQALRESVGPVDAIDDVRATTISKRDSVLTKWERRTLKAQANGKEAPRTPNFLASVDNSLDSLEESGQVVLDGVTGRLRTLGAKVDEQKWETPFDSSVREVPSLSALELHRYTNEFRDWLSNKGNAVRVRRTESGTTELSVVRRNVLGDRKPRIPLKPIAARTGEKGKTVRGAEVSGPFEGPGDMFRPANSSEQFNRNFYRSQELNTEAMRADNRMRTVNVGEKDFEVAWADAVNSQIRHSPIWRRMLDGWTNEEIVNWLRGAKVRTSTAAEGRQIAKRMQHKSHNPVAWTDELRAHLNHYLPDERLRAIARERDLTAKELSNLGKWDARPVSVDTVALKAATGEHRAMQAVNTFIDKAFHALATMPTDTLVRNPFFERNYWYAIKRFRDTNPKGGEILDPRVRAFAEGRARQYALKQTKLYMFSLADQSELTHMLRFMSPFVGAWQESIIRWARITTERPEAFSRLYVQGWERGPDKLYGIEEEKDPLTGQEVIRVAMPSSVKKGLAAILPNVSEEDLEGFENALVSKKSLNVTLQGEPWWLPSGGPLVQAPAAFFLRNSPEFQDKNAMTAFAWKYLFPAGRPKNAFDAIQPQWMKQFARYHAEGDDPVYNNMFLLVHRNDVQRWRDGGRVGPEPTIEESWDKSKGMQAFMTYSRLGSPFAFRLEPASQFWIDKAREYRELHGNQEGLKRFVDEMGEDAYLWWTSLSQTNVNVPPTSEGFTQYKKFKSQIEEFPELAPIIVGMDAFETDFNSEVYNRQREIPVGPGDPRKQRAQKTGPEFTAEVESRQGWAEYRDWRAAVDGELAARGLTSINQNGAEDLLTANRLFVDDQKEKLAGWGREFEQFDSGKGYAYVDTVRNWIQSGAADRSRPDIAGLAEYVELHDSFAAVLDARAVGGGSRSIEAGTEGGDPLKDNRDLAVAWDMAVGDLVQRNPMFSDIYHRYLERHSLRNGSN